ncbi:hypothetical protein LOTGIDRAFT_233316 [Lottia gigantea]|uniref:Gem-associated protein 8 n=1 Tax=Lottia gigantea TaxID=225164 RepID=V4AFC2_LOTGI|nr:hypothetical protein LOTGIDRAFT_233316 [Lottia gigantea]ESO92061.1 hypothetical protein LOTGIDRAFT_233316 [Lottia gigantea]
MADCELESNSTSADTSLDSESEFTCVTETQCEISEDQLNSDSVVTSSNTESSTNEPSRSTKVKGREVPDMTSQYWYTASCFDRYWKHYRRVMTWYGKHLQVYHNLQHRYSAHTANNSAPNRPKSKKKRKRRLQKQRSRKLRVDLSPSNTDRSSTQEEKPHGNAEEPMSVEADALGDELVETEEYEMEITDEMLEFFAKSQQHRKDRDSKDNQNGKATEMVNIEDAHKPFRTVEPPKERPGVRRTAEMKLLYGKGAAMIHGMETALKMSYDRNLDVKQPKVWPNIPLRIVFADT